MWYILQNKWAYKEELVYLHRIENLRIPVQWFIEKFTQHEHGLNLSIDTRCEHMTGQYIQLYYITCEMDSDIQLIYNGKRKSYPSA
jgi:hypothetical protein